MKQYYVEYYNKNNIRVGITVSAWDSSMARQTVEGFYDFNYLCSYPQEV